MAANGDYRTHSERKRRNEENLLCLMKVSKLNLEDSRLIGQLEPAHSFGCLERRQPGKRVSEK